MTTDPAVWIPTWVRDHWSDAQESLRDDGLTVTLPAPITKRSGDPDGALQRGAAMLKVYQAEDESVTPKGWGSRYKDTGEAWNLKLTTLKDNCRERAHDTWLVLERLLELYRVRPHEDWDRITLWRKRVTQDWPDRQEWVVTMQLREDGKALPGAVNHP